MAASEGGVAVQPETPLFALGPDSLPATESAKKAFSGQLSAQKPEKSPKLHFHRYHNDITCIVSE
jgi:hypothetical protein